jgi:hypothetical protein
MVAWPDILIAALGPLKNAVPLSCGYRAANRTGCHIAIARQPSLADKSIPALAINVVGHSHDYDFVTRMQLQMPRHEIPTRFSVDVYLTRELAF